MVEFILEIAEVEGEDYNLVDMVRDDSIRELLYKHLSELASCPPRIVISKLYLKPEWRNVVDYVAHRFIERKMSSY